MIQFNLLPDVKVQFIKTQRTKRAVMLISVIAGASALGLLALVFVLVNVLQKGHLDDLNSDIKKNVATLKAKPEIDKVLTVQNQLKSLPGLHDQKPVVSRLPGFIAQMTPNEVGITDFTADFDLQTISIQGKSASLEFVNRYVDTLKFTEYRTEKDETDKAFKTVVLAQFGRDDEGATFHIDLTYNPAIFSSASQVALTIPEIISTRSETEKPNPLFDVTNKAQ